MINIHLPNPTPPNWDDASRIRIGWLGLVVGYTEWGWRRTECACARIGVPARSLRYWSDIGLISCIIDAPCRRRQYMLPELDALRMFSLGRPITTKMIRQIIAHDLEHPPPFEWTEEWLHRHRCR